jgi:glycine dehydrogenase subunit 1
MALLGPDGFAELGELILQRSHYAAHRIGEIPGISVRWGDFFKEFVVDFAESGKTVQQINAALRTRGIFGGGDLSRSFPQLGQCALYCVTEVHAQADIDRLVEALTEASR